MFIAERSQFAAFMPFRSSAKRSLPNNFDLISRSFDENVLRRLKALTPINADSRSISFSWLSLAVDFISSTHAEAQALVTNLRSSDDTSSSYLDGSIKILDVCNLISSEIERLRQRRLLVNFALHLLEVSGDDHRFPAADKLRRSRDLLSDWENNSRGSSKRRATLIADLAAELRCIPPRGKISSAGLVIRRTIYAVGVLTVFVAGVAVAALSGVPDDVPAVEVPVEFLWADSLKDLQSAMNRRFLEGEKKSPRWLLEELDDVETRVRALRDVINGVVDGLKEKNNEENVKVKVEKEEEKLTNAVKEVEAAMGRFSDGLDRLANGVNGAFRKVLSTRNGVLNEYRKSNEPCYEKRLK